MSEFERKITEARRASREIASQVQQAIDDARDRRGSPVPSMADDGDDDQGAVDAGGP